MSQHRFRLQVVCALVFGLCITAQALHESSINEQPPGRHLTLTEGTYQVLRIVDPITLIVQKTPSIVANGNDAFPIRLASLQAVSPSNDRASTTHLQTGMSHLSQLIGKGQLELKFGSQRFDLDQTPLAYAFIDQRLLNAELVALGVANPKMLPNNSSRWQRQISQAQH